MNAKRVLLMAAILINSQAFGLTAYEKNHGCNHEVGDCPFGGDPNGGGGGGSDPGPATSMGVFGTADGGMVEFFTDSQGEWWIETAKDGTSQVGFDQDYGPKMKKKPNPGSKRPKYQASEMTKGPLKTLAAAKQKAAADAAAKAAAEKAAAKAAADKLAAEKAAADKAAALKAAGSYSGPALSASPAALGLVSGVRKKP